MCSFFGASEKLEAKLEDLVKKLGERLADIEDKQDSDYESNQRKFTELEDKVEDLTVRLSDLQKVYQDDIKDLNRQLDQSNSKQNKLQLEIDQLEEALNKSKQQQETFKDENFKNSNNLADIEVLKEMVHQQSALTMKDFTEIEMKFEERDDILHEKLEIVDKRFIDLEKISGKGSETNSVKFEEITSKFERIESRFEEMSNVMDNVMDKFYEFETQRKNNLIFYGVPDENNESSVRLLGKIREIIRSQIGIRRPVGVTRVCRVYTGPRVAGCHPVLLSLDHHEDRQEILRLALAQSSNGSCKVTVSEDYSRKTRTARSHLRRFGRTIRRDNPEKNIRLMEDKLVVDGKMFVYSEEEGVVRQHKVTGGGEHQGGKFKWQNTDSLESLLDDHKILEARLSQLEARIHQRDQEYDEDEEEKEEFNEALRLQKYDAKADISDDDLSDG